MTPRTGNPIPKRIGSSIVAPERTLSQRMAALDKADAVRIYRANLKRELKAGRKSILDILDTEDIHPHLATMKLFDLMLAVPSYGRVKVTKILQICRVSPSKTVGGLSIRQRFEVVAHLRR